MPELRRRLLVVTPPALALAFAWSRVERPAAPGPLLAVVAAALLPALARSSLARIAVAASGAVVVAPAALAVVPGLYGGSGGALVAAAAKGLRDFDVVVLPFDPTARPEMQGLLLLFLYLSVVVIALAAATARPLVCSAAIVPALGWPATIVPERNSLSLGALALAAALWPLCATRLLEHARVPARAQASVALVAVVAVASAAAALGVRPSSAAVAWREWDLLGAEPKATSVRLVWDANYAGISFPARKTVVLRIRAPRSALYWRASTLERFTADRWIESLYPVALGGADRLLPRDPLQGLAARRRSGWVEQRVEVAATVDDHLVAASEPVRLRSADLRRVAYLQGGVMRAPQALERGQEYTVWSAVPRPTPAELLRAGARYPAAARRYLEVDRASLPAFGLPGRRTTLAALFRDERYQALWPYRGVWERASAVTRRAGSPYEATVALERWLRSSGGFAYEERPPPPTGLPPLADFVERSRQGYCQQFAGSMALMLRLIGIPARVAVGFTSGTWANGVWTVTDHDAHAWVEVWFPGQGWVPFDPTPGRGTFSATYTFASDSADAVRALGTGRFLDFAPRASSPAAAQRLRPAAVLDSGRSSLRPYVAASAALILLLLACLAGAKGVRRRSLYAGAGHRQTATAARLELERFLRDQGVRVRAGAGVGEVRRALERLGVRGDGFERAFLRARYGPPQTAATAAGETRRELRLALRALRARLGPGRRLRGFLALRSLREHDRSGTIGA